MKHLYQNDDGEIVAADSKFEACKYHDQTLGGAADADVDVDDWEQIEDAAAVPLRNDENGTVEKKAAAEWAAEYEKVEHHATTYV